MTDTHQKNRPPLVPGPSGVAAKAVALREQKAELEKQTRAAPSPMDWEREQQAKRMLLPTPEPLPPPMDRDAPLYRTPGPVGNIAGAIASVMANIGTIEKGGYNAFHKYHYARMEDLLVVLTPLMGQAGLAVIQNEVLKEVLEGNRLAVTYEFSIFHKSGEVWPERPRFTGMSIGRDSKGSWDDKAINKCHTNARKYFLLALFQVPAGDFEDADADANQRPQQQPVPGPKSQVQPQPAARAMEQPREDVPGPPAQPAEMVGPQKIVLGQNAGPEQWASTYIQAIGKAMTKEELKQWDTLNAGTLQLLYDKYPDIYEKLLAAAERRLSDLDGAQDPMPKDPVEAMNWVAEQLQQFEVYSAAEAFWNTTVAPREKDFEQLDWEMLMDEWKRTEGRLAPEAGAQGAAYNLR